MSYIQDLHTLVGHLPPILVGDDDDSELGMFIEAAFTPPEKGTAVEGIPLIRLTHPAMKKLADRQPVFYRSSPFDHDIPVRHENRLQFSASH
jgi:hypothetical protein